MTPDEKFWLLHLSPGDRDNPAHDYLHGAFGLQITMGSSPILTCARTTSNTAYCWGADALEALGNGENIPDQKEYLSLVPSAVESAQQFDHIVASPDDFSCGITAARQAFCWGTNRIGTLGIGSVSRNGKTNSVRAFPVPVAKFLHR